MKISCGIIIEHDQKWLVCHVTNSSWWDFPKGVADEGEDDHLATALRELTEETSYVLDKKYLPFIVDLCEEKYKKGKNLHMFYVKVDEPINCKALKCTSMVLEYDPPFPEVDAFSMVHPDDAVLMVGNNMRKYILSRVFLQFNTALGTKT